MSISDWSSDVCSSDLWLGSLTGLPGTTKVLNTVKANVRSIYRFGQDINADGRYWFEFERDTDVLRGAIAGDTEERTYWADGVKPKKTHNVLALTSGINYPVAAYDLAVPRPDEPCIPIVRSEEQTSELHHLLRLSYSTISLKKST